MSAVNGDKRANLLPCTQYSALSTAGILQLADTARARCLERGSQSHSVSTAVPFFLTLFPVTGCRSWLWCLADCPSHANSNNSSSGKPFRTLPHHRTTAISFIYCILEPTSGLCPTPVSDEICLITSPGHQRKQTIYYCMPIYGLGIFPLPYLS